MANESKFLALFAPPGALKEFRNGSKSVNMARYAILSTEKAKEWNNVTEAQFKTVQDEFKKRLGTPDLSREAKNIANESDASKNGGIRAKNVTTSGVIGISKSHVTFITKVSLDGASGMNEAFGVSTSVLVKGKIIDLNMTYYSPSKKEIQDANKLAAIWVKSVLEANH